MNRDEQPVWKWFIGAICLALVSVSSGTPNLYPTFTDSIEAMLGISHGTALFMLTGGTLLLYITLPAGLLMDKFGSTVTLLGSVLMTSISYLCMLACKKIAWLFITLYLIGALGSASMFICCLQITLARSPPSIKGVSVSIVSAALSLSFGLWMQVFNAGEKMFRCTGECTLQKFMTVAILVSAIIIVFSIIAWAFYKKFPEDSPPKPDSSEKKSLPWYILKDPKLYLLASLMLLTVFDGLTIIAGGSTIWSVYGHKDGAITYGTAFSVTNCIATILISILLDVLIEKFKFTRQRLFAVVWMIFVLIHSLILIVFNVSKSKTAFGIVTSMMGIIFGFGLTHIPTLTSDIFGNNVYGFAFGVVQIGSMISAGATMPIITKLAKLGINLVFALQIVLHLITGLCLFFVRQNSADYAEVSPAQLLGKVDSLN